ncbi:MAG: type III-B CRISPR module-associated Cmr3 family protein, partial [Bacillota bacterium]|nr:type III-B CRISPR module-associated Cmr3 family protein [Bacillota bacterium]
MSIEYCFISPLDVLLLRGNQLFGDPGSYGESLIPPWPSVAAGAIRSRMLVDDQIDLAAFSRSEIMHPTLGTPRQPGSFVLAGFYLARKKQELTEILMAPPADLVFQKREDATAVEIRRFMPRSVDLPSSCTLPLLPVLPQDERSKSESGWWLTQAGWEAYLKGNLPKAEELVHSSELWKFDDRVGIG